MVSLKSIDLPDMGPQASEEIHGEGNTGVVKVLSGGVLCGYCELRIGLKYSEMNLQA
jgi:hypothetical protein